MTRGVTGWDVGGVNTKVARVEGGVVRELRSIPFEIQSAPNDLPLIITRLAREVGSAPGDHHAVTMTAELSQYFLTKREGVDFVLDAFESALPGSDIQIFGTDGVFRGLDAARRESLLTAASNWTATATLVASKWPEAVLLDVGTTTTDIIPIHEGVVAARGRTDPDRLGTGELLYLGALRTPVEAVVHEVPLGDTMAGVSAESFALVGDAYLWLGQLAADDYTVPTPDGRAATRAGARDRLARVVCADGEMLDDAAVDAIARHVARVQAERVARSLERVIAQHPSISTAVTAGLGSFIAHRAAGAVHPRPLAVAELGHHFTPAAAVALLLEAQLHRSRPPVMPPSVIPAEAGCPPAVLPADPGIPTTATPEPGIPAAATTAQAGIRTAVIPAKAGIHVRLGNMDPRFRGDDGGVDPRFRGYDRGLDPRFRGDEGGGRREHRVASETATHDARPSPRPTHVRTVVKVGGALLGRRGALDIVVPVLSRVAERGDPAVLIVPGGGPFADTVRRIDTEIGLSDHASHWMAILALDQYAELLASRITSSRVVRSAGEAAGALAAGELPILAPSDWLRRADPLPHSWDVTSDSIAAWVAGQVGAERLVLAKAVKADLSTLVDPHFARALPEGIEASIVDPTELASALGVS
jgi:probable H4MPT-linked C1 transfer pathway protein